MKVTIYLEGGGDAKALRILCREGFRKLFERCGFRGRMPHLVAYGGRERAFDDFRTAHRKGNAQNIALMLIDSEDPMDDINATWSHLEKRDQWKKPDDADDEQVLMMTTCMETWIVADRQSLRSFFGRELQESALPPVADLESRSRKEVQAKLVTATQRCSNKYSKGKTSFRVLAELAPDVLSAHLPSFLRTRRILDETL